MPLTFIYLTFDHYLFHMSSSKIGMVLGNNGCLKVSYCVGDSWSHEKLPVCASEFIPPKSLHPSVMHNAHFIIPPVHCHIILTQHSHHTQGTHATRPRCLTSPMERLSACLVELSTGALSTISYTDIQGS